MLQCLVNGLAGDVIHSNDRGLLYGDGLFETMSFVSGEIPLWHLHMARFAQGCERLKLACPSVDVLWEEVTQLTAGAERALIKLILTRGVGGRGYASPADAMPTRILQRHPWPEFSRDCWETGVRVIYCQQRLARQPALAGIKHLNRLEQVLARAEWQDPAIQEGLVADTDGGIIEGVSHNLFVVKGDKLLTPDLYFCGVAGVMREYLLSLLNEKGYRVEVRVLTKQELQTADGVFLCNSVHGIWPVCELDGKRYSQNRLICDLRDTVAQMIPYP
jgi:4-amino-4-deoxychorismate lyase